MGPDRSNRDTRRAARSRIQILQPIGAATFILKSANRKLSPCELVAAARARPRPVPRYPYASATYASIEATCPTTCPLRDHGCFVRHGATKKLALALDLAARGHSSAQVIAEEVHLIDRAFRHGVPQDGARGGRDLRLHVGGDIRGDGEAVALSGAAYRFRLRGGGAVWTFTHAWCDVDRSSWGSSISVLASVESAPGIEEARARGYAAAIVVPTFPTQRAFSLPGSSARIIPCPAETKGTTCVECRLCLDDRALLDKNLAIAFAVHGPGAKRAAGALVQLRTKAKAGAAP